MKAFLDTSALVKLYHQEEGTSDLFQFLSKNSESLYISTVSAIEFRSAIWKKVREKIIAANKAKIVIDFFLNDQDLFNWISLTDNLVTNAAKLIMKYGRDGLRTLDSLQLAAALTLKDDDSLFITYDELLKEFMIKEGLILTKNK